MIANLIIFKRMKLRVYIKLLIKVLIHLKTSLSTYQEFPQLLDLINLLKITEKYLDHLETRWIQSLTILNLK